MLRSRARPGLITRGGSAAAAVDPTLAYALSFTGATFPSDVTFTRSSTATAIDTATGVMTSFAVDAPRFGAAYGGFIREPAATNTVQNGSTWNFANCVGTPGAADPLGGTTAYSVVANAGTFKIADEPVNTGVFSSGTIYTLSRFVKPGTATRFQMLCGLSLSNGYANFLLTGNGSVSNSFNCTPFVQNVGGGWYRIGITVTAAGTANGNSIYPISTGSEGRGAAVTYAGTETYTTCFGQCEVGSRPTSYIPTTTTNVTRAADVPVLTPVSWFNDTEGTFVVKGKTAYYNSSLSSSPRLMVIDDGTVNEKHDLYADKDTGTFRGSTVDGGLSQGAVSGGALAQNTAFKAAYAYKLNDMASCLNGGTVGTDTSGTMPTGMTRLQIAGLSGAEFGGPIASIDYYNVRKINTDLQSLTT